MFVIVTYDIVEGNHLNKTRKVLKKYLTWTQNSVFEGEISESKLHKCMAEIENIIDKKMDSIYIYEIKNSKNIEKKLYGVHKSFDDMFLQFAVSNICDKIVVSIINSVIEAIFI